MAKPPRGQSSGKGADRSGARPVKARAQGHKKRRTETGRTTSTANAQASRKRRPNPKMPSSEGAPAGRMRIAKAIARAGLCSRRDAERWIADGRVAVNGKAIVTPALDVGPDDRVRVDGKPLPAAEPTELWRYAKPRAQVTTHRDPEGRPTVFDSLPDDMPRVLSIGRLDYNTEGLLLLTTNGELARYLELPSTGWLRRYRVRAHGRISRADLDALKEGVSVDGVHYGPIEATLDSQQGANVWLTIGLREGKNREVRKVLASLGLEVNRLIRVSFGPFQLLDLKPGTVARVRRRTLIDQLGPRLAERFQLSPDEDADAPAAAPARRQKRSPGAGSEVAHGQRKAPKTPRRDGARTPVPKAAAPAEPADPVEVDESNLDDIKPWEVDATDAPAAKRGRRRKERPAKRAPRKTAGPSWDRRRPAARAGARNPER